MSLFWEEIKKVKGGPIRERPKIPKTKWKPPSEFPNLSSCKLLAVDTETYDPDLLTHGPGWARGVGNIVGVSIAADVNNAWYFPVAHTEESQLNLSKERVFRFLKDVLEPKGVAKIGANITYDIGWLRREGIFMSGPFIDILFAEALIDETRFKYDLDSIAQKYLGEGKETNKLYRWAAQYYGGAADDKQRKNIYRCPPQLVGPYAEGDVIQPYRIWNEQRKILKKENLTAVFNLESRLIPLMIDMRFRGVRVDIPATEQAIDKLKTREVILLDELKAETGFEVNVNAGASIQKAFDAKGLKYPLTPKSKKASFTKDFLQFHPHKIADLIVRIRQVNKARVTFLENYILNNNVNGRLFCEFPQLKGEVGGTVSGRFSSRNPNLQNIPARDPESKLLIRGCFVPDLGFDAWGCIDFSQIEYRFLAHHAKGNGGKDIRRMYKSDATTDFHLAIIKMIYEIVAIELDRKPAKTINFGLVYGMGKDKLRRSLGLSSKESTNLMEGYHTAVPFVKDTFQYYADQAQTKGFIKTILGRRSRFNTYSIPYNYDLPALPYTQALKLYGPNIERAFTHKSLNRKLQGGAADYMKTAMVNCYESGIFDALGGPPHLTVHDELDFSFDHNKKKVLKEMVHTMNHAIELKVPMFTSFEAGPNWAAGVEYAI
jgi:DNA polymerase I-like protein with 3'-5' exonuclease and polymerase domains